jgi:hypothetical protein
MNDSNYDVAVRLRERFDLYFLGLIFTILGLSIQTARFGTSPLTNAAEILGWAALLTSGLVGLSNLEEGPKIYRLFGLRDDQEAMRRAGLNAEAEGGTHITILPDKTLPISDYVARAQRGVEDVTRAIEPLQRIAKRRYRLMKMMFVIGIGLVFVARALGPLLGVLRAIGWAHTSAD